MLLVEGFEVFEIESSYSCKVRNFDTSLSSPMKHFLFSFNVHDWSSCAATMLHYDLETLV